MLVACSPVVAEWKYLGGLLGVVHSTLERIQADNKSVRDCLMDMIASWLKKDVSNGVVPTWRNLCKALSHIDRPLAESISVEHGCSYISPAGMVRLFL